MKSETINNSVISEHKRSSSKGTSTFAVVLALLLLGWFCATTSYSEVVKTDKGEVIEAIQLATTFTQDQPAALTKYRDKEITIKGLVCKIQQDTSSSTPVIAYVFLQTAPMMPLIKISVTTLEKMQNDVKNEIVAPRNSSMTRKKKSSLNTKVTNDSLEARIVLIRTVQLGSRNASTKKEVGDWQTIVRNGDTVIVKGICKGRFGDIVVDDASL